MNIKFSSAVARGLLFLSVLALAACETMGGGGGGSVPGGSDSKKLAYGVTVSVPEGWQVAKSMDDGTATNDALNAQIAKGEPVMLLDMRRPAQNVEGMDARVGLFLVDATKVFPPEDGVKNAPQERFNSMADSVKQRAGGQIEGITINREAVDGKTALVQRVRGKGPAGTMTMNDWQVYLPAGKGLVIRMMGSVDVPGTENLLDSIARAVRIR